MRRNLARATVGVTILVVLTPSLASAEPGFSPVRQMPGIIGVPSTTLEAYASTSCPTPGSCTAVGPGFLINSQQFSPLASPTAVTETDGAWGPRVALPVPGNEVASTSTSAAVSSVRCTAVGDCTAVGSYPDGDGNLAPLIETEVSGTWSASSVELAGGASGTAELTSVWCASATSCVALGAAQVSGQPSAPVVAVESAGTWSPAVELPSGRGVDSSGLLPLAVACSSAGNCVASAIGGQSVAATVAWTERSGVWGAGVVLAEPRSMQFLGISIACPSISTCVLVGGLIPVSRAANQDMYPAARTDVSGRWSPPDRLPEPTLTPVTSQGLLTSIACPTTTLCEAVGGFIANSSGARARPGAFTWEQGRWSSPGMIRGVPLDGTFADQSYFTAVACSSGRSCLAVGPDKANLGKDARSSTFFASLTPTRPLTEPSRPTSIVVHPLHRGVTVRWSPPIDDGGAPVRSYTVTVSPAGGRCRSSVTTCDVTGLTSGRTYRVSVTVSTSYGTSSPTTPIAFVPAR